MSLENELKNEFNHWEHLKQFGGRDPFWEDGGNMNLVRNHIIRIKREMQDQGIQSVLLNKETPPEVDSEYMARADEIRTNAKKALVIYESDGDYQYLVSIVDRLNEKQKNETSINNVIGYCRGLKIFIEEDLLVGMRRHERYKHYLESFGECRKRVEEVIKDREKPGEQISLMDFV